MKPRTQKPKILCVCTMGLNRSKYLAKYLKNKGYSTRFGGVGPYKYKDKKENELKNEDIDWSDIIITVRPKHKPLLKKRFKTKGKKIIVIDVTDSKRKVPENMAHLRELKDWEFNKKWTYPQLRKAIKPYLPLKI